MQPLPTPDWTGICFVAQAGLELWDLVASASYVLVLKAPELGNTLEMFWVCVYGYIECTIYKVRISVRKKTETRRCLKVCSPGSVCHFLPQIWPTPMYSISFIIFSICLHRAFIFIFLSVLGTEPEACACWASPLLLKYIQHKCFYCYKFNTVFETRSNNVTLAWPGTWILLLLFPNSWDL